MLLLYRLNRLETEIKSTCGWSGGDLTQSLWRKKKLLVLHYLFTFITASHISHGILHELQKIFFPVFHLKMKLVHLNFYHKRDISSALNFHFLLRSFYSRKEEEEERKQSKYFAFVSKLKEQVPWFVICCKRRSDKKSCSPFLRDKSETISNDSNECTRLLGCWWHLRVVERKKLHNGYFRKNLVLRYASKEQVGQLRCKHCVRSVKRKESKWDFHEIEWKKDSNPILAAP